MIHRLARHRVQKTTLVSGMTVFVIASGLFLLIAAGVSGGGRLVALDTHIAGWMHANANPALTQFFLLISYADGLAPICVYTFVLLCVLTKQHDWYWVQRVGVIVPGGMLLNAVLKQIYQRPRPSFDGSLLTLQTYSFPSGHASAAFLFYCMLAAWLASRLRNARARAACFIVAALMVMLVSLSRMALGVHYLCDVLAAVCSSVAWTALCLVAADALDRRRAAR